MTNDDTLERLRRAAKKHLEERDLNKTLSTIAGCIGDRRIRDLTDTLAVLESEKGWNCVIDSLSQVQKRRYHTPLGIAKGELDIECLKFREVIFDTFGCDGLEAVPMSMEDILDEFSMCRNMAEAQNKLHETCEDLLKKLISKGNTLFFDSSTLANVINPGLLKELEYQQEQQISELQLHSMNDRIDITSLWYTEIGRRALLDIAIKGNTISHSQFELVLSVLQVSQQMKIRLIASINREEPVETSLKPSLNSDYADLLKHLIGHELLEIRRLGSKYAVALLNSITNNSIENYFESNNSGMYNEYLESLRNHVIVRHQDSLLLLEQLARRKELRISSPAITSLGNFYNRSVSAILVDLLCSTKNSQTLDHIVTALENVQKRCPETKEIVENSLDTECRNKGRLLKFYRNTWSQ